MGSFKNLISEKSRKTQSQSDYRLLLSTSAVVLPTTFLIQVEQAVHCVVLSVCVSE